MSEDYVSVKLDARPTHSMSQEWGVYEPDGSRVVRYRSADRRLYEDRDGEWFRLDLQESESDQRFSATI